MLYSTTANCRVHKLFHTTPPFLSRTTALRLHLPPRLRPPSLPPQPLGPHAQIPTNIQRAPQPLDTLLASLRRRHSDICICICICIRGLGAVFFLAALALALPVSVIALLALHPHGARQHGHRQDVLVCDDDLGVRVDVEGYA